MTIVQKENKIWIGQPAYTQNLLEKYGMQDCKSVNPLWMPSSNDPCIDQQQYQSVIGSLMYLSVSTRPDISFAVGKMTRYSSHPTSTHWKALKRVLSILKEQSIMESSIQKVTKRNVWVIQMQIGLET